MHDLAVVIPAYKVQFFDKALLSLSRQTNKNFTVYVGDDCSPGAIKAVCDKYNNLLSLHYHRFPSNLGGKDLVGQWERCAALMNGEKWLWLFSDDDIAEDQCVEYFYEALKKTNEGHDVYRFNTSVINEQDVDWAGADVSPEFENAMSLAKNILMGNRGNSMPDHIFRHSKYKELGGFINFDFAQAADWATSINFAYDHGLYTIAGPKVKWRWSGQNVSSLAQANKKQMIGGHIQFLEWINKRFTRSDETRCQVTLEEIREASLHNLNVIITTHYKGIPYASLLSIAAKIARIYDFSFWKAIKLCVAINYRMDSPQFKHRVKMVLTGKFLKRV
ncbi:MAG: glycosyltransferase [Chitinophagaceae bacterium]